MKSMKAMKAMKTMKAMKGMKAMKAMKKMKVMKAMKKSVIAKGKRAKVSVIKGFKEKTATGLKKADLMVNKRGKVVSKKAHAAAKKKFQAISGWLKAVTQARKELGIKGFCPVGGKTAQGKALYAKAKSLQ
eukprot:CAMPEP_0114675924 /NCGR_PEP_ID=MMETSP0191-20121206/48533_1 /TAXON_ID=126664 /ORGANISM="Sorites sp." /LENGTH=130 /DNA_ID=CAMNT_0001946031 /DNA_START=92 /DNA_END=484 /DNA_ORIENTATION=-